MSLWWQLAFGKCHIHRNIHSATKYSSDDTLHSPWLKEVKWSNTARNAVRHAKLNHSQPLPLITTTPIPSCGVSHSAPSGLHSALHSSVSLWSQHQDLSLSQSLSQSVWSAPRCVHLELWLNRNDIYQTQPCFSCAVVKPASDSDCFNERNLVSECVHWGFSGHMIWGLNASTCRMEMNSFLQPSISSEMSFGDCWLLW